jgi:hypothetical protein
MFHTPGEGYRGHEIHHHVIILELVLGGVRVVQVGLLKESLEVVYRRPHLLPATVHGSDDAPQVRATEFLVIVVIVVSRGHNPLRTLLAPLLAALGALLGILDGAALLLPGVASLLAGMARCSATSLPVA